MQNFFHSWMMQIVATFSALAVVAITILLAAGCATPRPVHSLSLNGTGELLVTSRRECIGLSLRTVHGLALRRTGTKELIHLTGRIGTLPKAARYLEQIVIENVRGTEGESGMGLYGTHYIDPSLITREEFLAVCSTWRNRPELPPLNLYLDRLVYGNPDSFYEVFTLQEGFSIHTDRDGFVLITDNANPDQLTLPAEKRRFNHIGWFDAENRLYLPRGRVLSTEVEPDFFGRPSLKVERLPPDGMESPLGAEPVLIDVLWAEFLYPADGSETPTRLLAGARDSEGRRLDEAFTLVGP